MNTEGTFQYKCRRCGEIDNGPTITFTNTALVLHEVITEGESKRLGLRMNRIHGCPNGGQGISDLIGVEISGK